MESYLTLLNRGTRLNSLWELSDFGSRLLHNTFLPALASGLPHQKLSGIHRHMNCSIQRQLTIALENRPGVLARVATTLAEHSVNIRGICVQDSVEQGVVRLLPNPWEEALATLRDAGFHPVQADIIEIETNSVPGALGHVTDALGKAGINIEYMYGTEPAGSGAPMSIVLKVSDSERALEVIQSTHQPAN